jgi:hypothetical protein
LILTENCCNLTDKQKFDLRFKYNNFGYDNPEDIPFNTGRYFYNRYNNAMLTIEFLEEFINVINIKEYLGIMYIHYNYYTRYTTSVISLIEILLNYENITPTAVEFIMSHYALENEIIIKHYSVFDKYTDKILCKNISNWCDNPFYTKEAEKFFSTSLPTSLNYLKWNLLRYYKIRREDDSNERAFIKANL